MQAFMKRNRLWPPCVLALLALTVALYALFSLNAIPSQFQYLWLAPAPVSNATAAPDSAATTDNTSPAAIANTGMRDARLGMADLKEALSGACEPTTLYAIADGMSVIANQDNATAVTARLEAIDDGAYALKPLVLKSGRLIYTDEFQTGTKVALVDEKLAVALFNYAEPTGRSLLLNGETYRIVGIVNDHRQVGDHWEYALYVPYRAVEKSALTMTALCIQTKPVPGAGGWAAFESATAALGKQGTCLSLTKEKMNAALPLRTLACLFGFMLVFFGLRVLTARSVTLYRAYRLRLREQYAIRLMPWVLSRGLPLLVGFAACAFAFAQLFLQLVAPVYTFPEWIPKVLVEPNDIAAAFWNVWQKQASLMELRSPELLQARFYQTLMGWACGALVLTGGVLATRLGDALRYLTAKPQADLSADEHEG